MFLIHQGSSSRANCNSVKLQCKRYYRMRSNFKKFKGQISPAHISTYWYIPVRTGIDINHTRALHCDDALAAFLRRRVTTARLTCSSCLALFLTAVSATERPPRWLTSYTLPPSKASTCVMLPAVFCTGTGRPARSLCRAAYPVRSCFSMPSINLPIASSISSASGLHSKYSASSGQGWGSPSSMLAGPAEGGGMAASQCEPQNPVSTPIRVMYVLYTSVHTSTY